MKKGAAILLFLFTLLPLRAGDGIDDVVQHVPMGTVLTLKAAGVGNTSTWPELLATCAASYALSAGVAYGLKHTVREWRPDRSDRHSFPSGHATFAFAGATALRHEYGHLSPWVTVGGYAVATLTAADRVARDRHHWYDVTAGTAIGLLATELTYYVRTRIGKDDRLGLAFTGSQLSLAYRF